MLTIRRLYGVVSARRDERLQCLRCGVQLHFVSDKPGSHLCADIAARIRHQAASVRDAIWSEYAREITVLGGEA